MIYECKKCKATLASNEYKEGINCPICRGIMNPNKIEDKIPVKLEGKLLDLILNKNLNEVYIKNVFRIIGKETYKIEVLANPMKHKCNNEYIEEQWSRISKGYNFILAKEVNGETYYYSVDYINERLGAM